MTVLEYLEGSPLLWTLVCALLGLIVGSFLNVVISRLPRMMEAQWRSECALLLETEAPAPETLTLSKPASHCPKCKAGIRPWQNIPVFSYLWLRGKCANCGVAIPLQYPVVELCCALLSAWAAAHFGYGFAAVAAIILAWILLSLTVIDAQTQLLPDSLVLPLLWLGLFVNLFDTFVPLADAVVGAMAGYLSLWLVYHGFRLITGKEGMGYGDFKLFAALGAWAGWQQLPWIILASSLVGAIIGIGLMASKRLQQGQPMPFGPYLAIAGWLAFLYGTEFSAWYMRQLG